MSQEKVPEETFSHVVVVGASAGGVEALSELVSALPEDLEVPVVLAQHLDPERESNLQEILGRRSSLPVRTVTEHEPLKGGVVYVVPANHHVNITDSELDLSKKSKESLRESERRFRALIDKGADVITISDRDGVIRYASPSIETVCGHPVEEFVGVNPFELGYIHPDDIERCGQALRGLVDRPGHSVTLQHRYRHESGEWRWLEGTFTSLFHDPAVGGLVANFRDITERKKTEEEHDRLLVKEWVARAEAAERERISRELHDRVAHSMGVAHQSLQLYEVFAKKDASRAAEKLELAKEMTKAALESTRNLSAELRSLDVESSLEAGLRQLLDASVPPGIHAEVDVEGEESLVSEHLRDQLFLILREAVRNAVIHSECGSISVVLEIGPGSVVGRVEDDGKGFDTENGHAGVGLRSMRERAALLDGTLELVCEPGRGTRVAVSLPLEGGR